MESEDTKESTLQGTTDAEDPEAPRRSFMKGTIAAAAGGIVMAAGSANAQQGKASAARISGTVQAHFDAKSPPKLADLQKVVAQIVSRAGCPTCGLLGVDLRLTAGDPFQIEGGIPVNVIVTKSAQ